LIEYCETIGIDIPHYCYHKNLSISGNCRMCLVELKNSPKPVVSCAMSAKACLNNGEIYTNSPLVKKARENILEFLLLNHPLDCPICDQGGECDLQDQSFFFGMSKKRFYNFKRIVNDKNIGPIVKTVMTRCIHCTRCVRFANEIAGVEDLGIFGRGVSSEIGTYVTKTFQSELSGNIIDLCPVGALTAKPYPFLGRNWELKIITSIDFSDAFGLNLQICLKNNKIVKILPGYNQNIYTTNWISDKSRFSFDGMFSSGRILHGFIIDGKNNKITSPFSWKMIFEEIIYFLYFQDHLNRHFLVVNSLIIVFDQNISIEMLNLLMLLSKKYSFILLRKIEPFKLDNELESKFLLTTTINKLKILSSNLCFLLGINTRYEGFDFNLKLRQRYIKGNFKVISLGSLIDLTFSISYLGFNLKILKSIIEGNNFFCQELVNYSNPLLVCSSEIFKRKDSIALIKFLTILKNYIRINNNKNWNNINVLNTSLSDVVLSYLNNFKYISENDLKKFSAFYFINSNFFISNFRKVIELQLLNYFQDEQKIARILIEQNCGMVEFFDKKIKEFYNIFSYFHLPNSVLYENSGTFITTEGFFKKSVKIISSDEQSKENWQIFRKFLYYLKNLSFLNNIKINTRLNFNNNSIVNLHSFMGFHYYAIKNLTKLNLYYNKKIIDLNLNILLKNYKFKRNKIFETKFRLWLDDFYIGGRDFYSKYSLVMIRCSKIFRLKNTNFNYIF